MKAKKASRKKSAKFVEKMPPSKKISMKGGKKVAGRNYSMVKEKYDEKMGDIDNHPALRPADISTALRRAKEGYSSKPRVKMDKSKGRGK